MSLSNKHTTRVWRSSDKAPKSLSRTIQLTRDKIKRLCVYHGRARTQHVTELDAHWKQGGHLGQRRPVPLYLPAPSVRKQRPTSSRESRLLLSANTYIQPSTITPKAQLKDKRTAKLTDDKPARFDLGFESSPTAAFVALIDTSVNWYIEGGGGTLNDW